MSDVEHGAMITHGDDQCLNSEGGVVCEIRQMPKGYATMMSLPWMLSVDQNDVRANESEPLEWYMLIAVKGLPRPDDGSLKSWTQIRLTVYPIPREVGYFGVYFVPANDTSVYWRGDASWAPWSPTPRGYWAP